VHVDQVPQEGSLPSHDLSSGEQVVEGLYGAGIAVKISRGGSSEAGILQLEYSHTDNLYWDVSDLDGAPFRDANVRVTPTGSGANEGENKCYTLDCPAGQVCQEAYQDPYQEATRSCPADTGDLILDLCLGGEPSGEVVGPVEGPKEGDEEEEADGGDSDRGRGGGGRWGGRDRWSGRNLVRQV